MKSLFLFLLAAWLVCEAVADSPHQPSIGIAEMRRDGTIVLRLRATATDGASGEAYLIYPKSHPDYQKILQHIRPISPGKSVPVRPWPDDTKAPNKSVERTAPLSLTSFSLGA
jgi:hypothetical protein